MLTQHKNEQQTEKKPSGALRALSQAANHTAEEKYYRPMTSTICSALLCGVSLFVALMLAAVQSSDLVTLKSGRAGTLS